jgi:hypothetical protein
VGVSGLAGDVARTLRGWLAIGYAPGSIPDHVLIDTDADRYSEVRRTDRPHFGVAEILRYWADVLSSDLSPKDVRVLAFGGGELSAIEYGVALALGARVGVIAGTGGTAATLLREQPWATSDRLIELQREPPAIRAFLGASA